MMSTFISKTPWSSSIKCYLKNIVDKLYFNIIFINLTAPNKEFFIAELSLELAGQLSRYISTTFQYVKVRFSYIKTQSLNFILVSPSIENHTSRTTVTSSSSIFSVDVY